MYYIHAINPHHGAEFADVFFEGFKYGLTQTEETPLAVIQFVIMFPTWEDAQYALDHNTGLIEDRTNGKGYGRSVGW